MRYTVSISCGWVTTTPKLSSYKQLFTISCDAIGYLDSSADMSKTQLIYTCAVQWRSYWESSVFSVTLFSVILQDSNIGLD